MPTLSVKFGTHPATVYAHGNTKVTANRNIYIYYNPPTTLSFRHQTPHLVKVDAVDESTGMIFLSHL